MTPKDRYQVSSALAIVESQAQRFTRAIRQGDIANIVRLHTSNARLLPPGSESVQGREAIQVYYQFLLDNGAKDMQFETVDAQFLGEQTIREIGYVLITLQTPSGNAQELRATYVVCWQLEGDEYKIDVDIWNH